MAAEATAETGSEAPDFSLPAGDGATVSLSDLRGGPVVLYFYPKDDTSGCTREAIDFSARIEEFEAAGATVLGVSKDSVKKHGKFAEKHGLKVQLLSDETSDVCERYGVWKEKAMYGRKFMGIERSTFLIDGDGMIRKQWRKVKVPGHVEEVMESLKEL